MAQQFNAIIATQTDHWRGTSAISIAQTANGFPNFRAISGAAYAMTVTGGVSGSFGVAIKGSIGGTTYTIAGLTTITVAGDYVLYHVGYALTGAENVLETSVTSAMTSIAQVVPPSTVELSSVIATQGISAAVTVSACLYANR